MSFVSSKGNILCRLINIELYKIFAIINRAIKGLHCSLNMISKHLLDGLFLNFEYTLVVIVPELINFSRSRIKVTSSCRKSDDFGMNGYQIQRVFVAVSGSSF